MLMPPANQDELDDALWDRKGTMLGKQFRLLSAKDIEAPGNWARVVCAETLDNSLGESKSKVALKIMRARHRQDHEVYTMFGREARILEQFGAELSAVRLLGT